MNPDPTAPDPELDAALNRLDTAATGEEYASALTAFYTLAATRANIVALESFEQVLRNLAERWRAHARILPPRERVLMLGCAGSLMRLCSPTEKAPLLVLTTEQLDRAFAADPFLARRSEPSDPS